MIQSRDLLLTPSIGRVKPLSAEANCLFKRWRFHAITSHPIVRAINDKSCQIFGFIPSIPTFIANYSTRCDTDVNSDMQIVV